MPVIKQEVNIMNYMDRNITIGEVVSANPASGRIFKKYGVDFCCGGNRKLHAVIDEMGLDEAAICDELAAAKQDKADGLTDFNFAVLEPLALSDYINDRHHGYLRKTLPHISDLLLTIIRVHGVNHPELYELYKLFGSLRTELEQHLLKEETMLFPAFESETDKQDEIRRLASVIIQEHEAAGEILAGIREVTEDFTLPEDACTSFGMAYSLLEELEDDLHQHIHLENNILLKEYDERSNN